MTTHLSNSEAEQLVRTGVTALQQGRPAEARASLEQVTATGRASSQIWLLLATACRNAGDHAAEEAALDSLLAIEPRNVWAQVMKGDCRARVDDDAGALGFYTGARMSADGQRLPDDLLRELQRIDAASTGLRERIAARREQALADEGSAAGTRSPRFQQSLDILSGTKAIFLQEPTAYYFPGLPQVQFFDPADFPWAAKIEAATPAILAELQALLAAGLDGFKPYIRSDPSRPRLDENRLLDSLDWSALFLAENGQLFGEVIARAPRAWAAVQATDPPRITNSPTAMFSLLRPGAHITPHTGTHNTRLTCHLPLIVPPDCAFRVGNEVREWEVGKLLIFDDTIEHEAWNRSNEDRVVLIFDIWRPELSAQERREIGALFAASGA